MEHVPTPGMHGWITHTDLVSRDPLATRAFCEKVFGWNFHPPMPSPNGEYHLFYFSEKGGGGIAQGEVGTGPQPATPFVHVDNAQMAYDHALANGAESVRAPERVMEGVTIGLVRAPGGVLFGISGP